MEKEKMLGVRIDKELIKKLKIYCAKKEISVREFVEELIEKAIK